MTVLKGEWGNGTKQKAQKPDCGHFTFIVDWVYNWDSFDIFNQQGR